MPPNFRTLPVPGVLLLLAVLALLSGCARESSERIGRFDPARDLFLAHFDSKTDVDDIHSIAGVATMLADPRFAAVDYHAVAGAYGTQEGLYVPSEELFQLAFGEHWSDAHADFAQAREAVVERVAQTLAAGGQVWIAEAGQSDFSAAVAKQIASTLPEVDLSQRFHVVQHADWNEEVTSAAALEYVRTRTAYHKIPDGNGLNNGTPGFKTETWRNWRDHVTDERLVRIWETAIAIADRENGTEGRYLNTAIAAGGMDFSDVAEACWIFGYEDLVDAEDFFRTFGR